MLYVGYKMLHYIGIYYTLLIIYLGKNRDVCNKVMNSYHAKKKKNMTNTLEMGLMEQNSNSSLHTLLENMKI